MENTILSDAAQVTNEAQQAHQESGLSDDARNIALAMSLASQDESIRNTPEMQELMGMIEKEAQGEKKAPSKTPTFEKPKAEEAGTESKTGETSKEKSVFFSKGETQESTHDLTNLEGVKAYFKENYGTDNLQEAIQSIGETKSASEKIAALTQQNEEVQEFLVGLPDDLYSAMEAHYNGLDYKAELAKANSKVDFTKPFTSNNEVDVVNHYFPGDFGADDFVDKADNDMLQRAIKMSQKSFERDAMIAAEDKAALTQSMSEKTAAVRSSIDTSIKHLKKNFPEISESAVDKIQKAMVSGSYKSIFFNKDGSFTNDAAKSIALAMYGDQEIRNKATGAARQAANKVVEDVITRGADKPKETAKNAHMPKQEDNSFMKLVGQYLPSDNTYSARQ